MDGGGGVVKVEAVRAGRGVQLAFKWAAPAGAAVFRRGDGLWVVFDSTARLDVSALPKDASLYSKVEAIRGAGNVEEFFSDPVFAAKFRELDEVSRSEFHTYTVGDLVLPKRVRAT